MADLREYMVKRIDTCQEAAVLVFHASSVEEALAVARESDRWSDAEFRHDWEVLDSEYKIVGDG